MNKDIFAYLRSYSVDPEKINRLIVSAFVYSFNIERIRNEFINSFLITPVDEDYPNLTTLLGIHKFSDIEELIEVFEFVISPEKKVVSGAIYTPKYIREFIIDNTISKLDAEINEDFKVCDPACGCSGFLLSVSKKIKEITGRDYDSIFSDNIYGLDIQDFSIERSKILLSLLAISEGEDIDVFQYNFFIGDALNFEWDNEFDLILGNPPYVCSRNIDEKSRVYLQNWSVCSTGHPDLYIPFFQIGLEILKENGVLGYITVNSFFKSINGRALRAFFQEKTFNFSIVDFGNSQIFKSKSTYTCICFLKNITSRYLEYSKVTKESLNNSISYIKLDYCDLDSKNGWNLQDHELTRKMESVGIPFQQLYKTRNGIATLKNKVYIFTPVDEDEEHYYLKSDTTYKIEKTICKDIINPNKLIEQNDINSLRQKIIFPYYYEGREIKLYDEKSMISLFPQAYRYLNKNRSLLAKRDKGNGQYENWYAYGRNQSLEKMRYKLFFPHISNKTPNFVLNYDENLLFHNGLAVVSDNVKELKFLQKLMSTKLFWSYIVKTSKPYGSGYFSLSRNYLKKFGVYRPTNEELEYIVDQEDLQLINDFFNARYKL